MELGLNITFGSGIRCIWEAPFAEFRSNQLPAGNFVDGSSKRVMAIGVPGRDVER